MNQRKGILKIFNILISIFAFSNEINFSSQCTSKLPSISLFHGVSAHNPAFRSQNNFASTLKNAPEVKYQIEKLCIKWSTTGQYEKQTKLLTLGLVKASSSGKKYQTEDICIQIPITVHYKKQEHVLNLSLGDEGCQGEDICRKLPTTTQYKNKAKNIIFFLGTGMSVSTLTASRFHLSQRSNKTREYSKLAMDDFPYIGLSKTECADAQVADSACSATANMCGVKSNFKTIGVTDNVKIYDCQKAADKGNQVSSILEWAQISGKSAGIVTTTSVTHASSAANYAHTSHREMESDFDIRKMRIDFNKIQYCRDIAQQLVKDKPGKYLKVIMGGGRNKFLPWSFGLPISEFGIGERLDGQDLVKQWLKYKKKKAKYIANRDELLNTNVSETDYLLGLFSYNQMKYNLDNYDQDQPSLAEMTETAIKILQKNQNGFYLFVENGHIDFAHHETLTRKALDETIEFSKAINVAKSMTSTEDTLIVVTSGYSHSITMAENLNPSDDILGLSSKNTTIDELPYTSLSYAYGIDTKRLSNGIRKDISKDDFNNINYTFASNIPMHFATHSGEDVAVFASGPWSHLFTGTYEQNLIPHIMAYAACIGEGSTCCTNNSI